MGEFYTFINEIDDGYDSIEWAASQPRSSGKVGMNRPSYVGATQWLAARSQAPSLTAIAPTVTASDYHEGWAWQGGAFELGFNLSWAVGALTEANWRNLSERLNLTEGGKTDLTSVKDSLTSAFNRLPMSKMEALKGGLAPVSYTHLTLPTKA